MIKKFFWIIIVLYLLVIFKFFIGEYSISYELDGFNVKEIARDGYVYIEIKVDGKFFNYMFYDSRKLTKKRVKDIEIDEINDDICVKPIVKGFDSYFVCSNGSELLSYDSLKVKDNYETLEDNFKYYKNLSNEEHVYIWKYDGFYYLNSDKVKSINIFKSDRYSNDLMIKVKNFLIFPNYDDDYLFSDFVVLDMSRESYEIISSKYNINYDSYFVGTKNNNLYLFDNKNNTLYEINYKKGKVFLIGDEKKGFIKYVDGKKKSASLDEYLTDKITYFEDDKSYYKVNKNYLTFDLNKKIKFKYFDDENIDFIDGIEDNLYFIFKDKLYKYSKGKSEMILHYFEFNFNKKNNVFVYNE